MKTYIASLLRHAFTTLAGLGGFLLSINCINPGDVSQINAAGASISTAFAGILTALFARLLLTLTGKMFSASAGDSSGTSGGALLMLFVLGTLAGIMGCLPACSTAQLAAAKSIPVHTTLYTDYGTASYDSRIGLAFEVDAKSEK